MKKTIIPFLSLLILFQTGFGQKVVTTPSKEVVFKPNSYWQAQHDAKLQAAPAKIKNLIISKNQEFEKQGKTLRLGYTNVFNVPAAKLVGFHFDGKRDIKLDNRPLGGPAPAMCLNITETAQSRKVDMRDYGVITEVRNQENCGGCWAFAATAALETSVLMKNGGDATALNLSEAQILTCASTFPGRCGGGIQADAIGFMKDNYIATESEFQFVDATINSQSCMRNAARTTLYRANEGGWVSGSVFLPNPGLDAIKRAIIRYGSVASCIHSTPNFQAYRSGVYDLNDNATVIPNHVIQIIGWDDDQQAWLIKNSWDTTWGMGGFGWVRYNTNVVGGYAIWIEARTNANNPCVSITNNPNQGSNDGNVNATYAQLLERFPFPRLHRIQNVQNNLTVEVDDPVIGSEKGKKVQQWSAHGQIPLGSDGHNQEWWLLPSGKADEKPLYRILNYGFTKYLTDNAGVARSEDENSSNNQVWVIENSPVAGVYYFKNYHSGKYLQVPAGNRSEGAVVSLGTFTGADNQKFRLNNVTAGNFLGDKENNDIYIIPSHATNMAIDLPAGNYADNVQLQIYQQQNGNRNQAFKIEWNDAGKAYRIISRQREDGNKVLDMYGFSRDNGGRAVIWENVHGENQLWYIIPMVREGGKFIIINKLSGKSLDVSGVGRANGTPLVQWDFVNGGNQKWEFRRF